MPEDWFSSNAPQQPGDWFSTNAPAAITATISPTLPSQTDMPNLRQMTAGAGIFEMSDRLKGVLRDIGNIGLGGVQYLQNLTGSKVSPTPTFMEPSTDPNQQIGEKIGSIIPAALASGASLPVQTAAGALTGGLLEQQAGGTGTTGAIVGGALPFAAQTAGEVLSTVAKKTAPIVNRWLQVAPKEMEHGADPGARLVQEKLVGITKQDTAKNLAPALTDAGNQLNTRLLQATGQGTVIDGSNIVQNALNSATKTIGKRSDAAFQNSLNTVFNDILQQFPDVDKLTPLRAQQLKIAVGDAIKWHGAAYEGDINEALLEIYRGLNTEIKGNVPGVGPIQSRWGDLYVASKSLADSLINDKAGVGTGNLHPLLSHTIKAGAVAAGAGAVGGGLLRLTR